MNRDITALLNALPVTEIDAVEVSGELRAAHSWRSYQSLQYPAFDLCESEPPAEFDLVICEQVLEHVRKPWAAAATLRQLARPGGLILVNVPFLVRLHGEPDDYWRFTPHGLRVLLEAADLDVEWVRAWGNRAVVRANLKRWPKYTWWRSLRSDAEVPTVVWALARRPST